MPQRKNAEKALRQNIKRRAHNLVQENALKTLIKKFKKIAATGEKKASQESLNNVYKMLDRATTKKLIHKNKASRLKSRLSLKLSAKKA